MTYIHPSSAEDLPYSFSKLDDLMETAKIDVLLATSRHNVRYLLGGYQFIFFSAMEAIGHSRYLPVIVYVRGAPQKSAYVANVMEQSEHDNNPFWVPHFFPVAWTSVEGIAEAVRHLKASGNSASRIGIEPSFLPADAQQVISDQLPHCQLGDATHVLERLRAVKSEAELSLLRQATDRISDSMVATIAKSHAGDDKHKIVKRLRHEEESRELHFEYCLLTLGSSHNRAISGQAWKPGEILSIDSGGNYFGYVGDICRVGCLGEPDSEQIDLLAQVESVQQSAFSKVRAGAIGREIIESANMECNQMVSAEYTDFYAHGVGLISHEAPFLVTNHPVTYVGVDADQPLEAGMVLSIETTMLHPKRGFFKLEDTISVTRDGYELFGADSRGWNLGGTA